MGSSAWQPDGCVAKEHRRRRGPGRESTKKPVASVKPDTKKGIGLVKASAKAASKRKTA